jgi:hypothetical protein
VAFTSTGAQAQSYMGGGLVRGSRPEVKESVSEEYGLAPRRERPEGRVTCREVAEALGILRKRWGGGRLTV